MSVQEPVRPGYKQTEVGVIPKDWAILPSTALGSIQTGPFGTVLKASEYSRSDGVPIVSVGEIGEGRIVLGDRTPLAPIEVTKRLPVFVLREGDIVFGRKGAVDRSCLVREEEDGWFLGSDGIRLRPSKATTYPNFLAAQLQLGNVRSWLMQHATGTTMATLNHGVLNRLLLKLPPLPEQRAIAAALSDVDALIAALDALVVKKRDIKQAAMQQLLTGKTRLPGFRGQWEVKRLGEYGDFKGGNGFALKYQGKATGEFPFFKVSDMNNEGNAMFMLNSNHWVSGKVRSLLGATAFPQNSIVFAKIGAAIFLERKKMLVRSSCIDNNMMAFVFTRTDVDPAFFYYRFLTIELGKLVSATALPSLNGRDIAALKFGFPPLAEQSAIAAVLSDIDAELAALEARRDKTRELKQGMMQELLTGRIRLV